MNKKEINWDDPNLDLDEILKQNPGLDDYGNIIDYSDIDRIEGFKTQKNISNIIELEGNELEGDELDLIIENLEKNKNVIIHIDIDKKSVFLLDKKNNNLIGEIFISAYKDGDFEREIHLYNVVEDEYKGIGWGQILFGLYEIISESNNDFILPIEEYTNVVSMINLYKKFGYTPKYKIVNGLDIPIELNKSDFEEMENIIKEYKNGNKESKLKYTVIMERNK